MKRELPPIHTSIYALQLPWLDTFWSEEVFWKKCSQLSLVYFVWPKKEQNLICFKFHYTLLSYPVNPFFFLIIIVNTHTFFRIIYYCKFNNFLLQTCALFGLYCLGFITSHKLCNILFGLLVCTFVSSFVFVDRNNIIV